jgi:hypothetical protein
MSSFNVSRFHCFPSRFLCVVLFQCMCVCHMFNGFLTACDSYTSIHCANQLGHQETRSDFLTVFTNLRFWFFFSLYISSTRSFALQIMVVLIQIVKDLIF